MTTRRPANPVMMTAHEAVLEQTKVRVHTRQDVLQKITACVRTAAANGRGSVTIDASQFESLDNVERWTLINLLEEHGYTVWWPRWFGRWSAKMVISWE